MKMTHIYGVLGLIKIFGKIAVLYIEDADLVCLIQEAPIFHIKKVGLMLLDTVNNIIYSIERKRRDARHPRKGVHLVAH